MNFLITGTGNGLGQSLARNLAEDGHAVFGISRRRSPGISLANYQHFYCDIVNQGAVEAIATQIHDHIDVLINNAGIPGHGRQIHELNNSEVQNLLNVNLFGCINTCRAFLDHINHGNYKRIINISSRFGSMSFNQRPEIAPLRMPYSYRIAKAAMNMFSVCLGNELKEQGITVNVIHPGQFIGGCGRFEPREDPAFVARRIIEFALDEGTRSFTKLTEIGKEVFDW